MINVAGMLKTWVDSNGFGDARNIVKQVSENGSRRLWGGQTNLGAGHLEMGSPQCWCCGVCVTAARGNFLMNVDAGRPCSALMIRGDSKFPRLGGLW